MFFKGISFGSLILVFLIIIVFFGTKRIREIGTDLGAAVKSFRKGMQEDDDTVVVAEKPSAETK